MTSPDASLPVERYAVIGHPIAHSRSPAIHAMFAEALGHAVQYERILAPLDGFDDAIDRFFAEGGKGLNVTVPFKLQAWQRAQRRTARAAAAGALNTLWIQDGELRGDNTDGVGLVRDLSTNLGLTIAGRRVLVVGAGGAARGVLQPLLQAAPSALVIVNRTLERAQVLAALARELAQNPVHSLAASREGRGRHCTIEATDFMAVPDDFDIIINATSAGLSGEVPPLPAHVFGADAFAYDMMYGSKPTWFMDYAVTLGARGTADGLGMLVEQAAESFLDWRGLRPNTLPVIAAMRERIRNESHQAL
jgi:shikimate dehydrogenase